jgi:hypothetical protein
MAGPTRRQFLATSIAVPTAAAACGRTRIADGEPLNDGIVRALCEAILPSSLGTDGAAKVAGEFQAWLSAYRPGAERNHGYGTGELTFNPDDPTPRWSDQLALLDGDARREHARSFVELAVAERQTLVAAALSEVGGSIPSAIGADHVAVAVLAFFYASPDATNLCYGAAINPRTCRPLSESPRAPVVLPAGAKA